VVSASRRVLSHNAELIHLTVRDDAVAAELVSEVFWPRAMYSDVL
jgi:hypothetical protein